MIDGLTIHEGHVLETLRLVPDASVQCIVTSPPYWGLRDYGTPPVAWPAVDYTPMPGIPCMMSIPAGDASLGLEDSLDAFIGHLVAIFRELRRVLKPDGVAWVNMGDGYNAGTSAKRKAPATGVDVGGWLDSEIDGGARINATALKPKDLIGQPWRLAFALQADGWHLRQDVIWHKPNPMPESCRDRCTKAHEYLFLLSKSPRYYWDKAAMSEPVSGTAPTRGAGYKMPDGWDTGAGGHGSFHRAGREKGKTPGKNSRVHVTRTPNGAAPQARVAGVNPKSIDGDRERTRQNASFSAAVVGLVETRNRRSVWTIPPAPFREAHFATFPPALVRPCILSSSREGDVVLDPFGGSLTTAQVALEHGRQAIVHELNADYIAIGRAHRLGKPSSSKKSPSAKREKAARDLVDEQLTFL